MQLRKVFVKTAIIAIVALTSFTTNRLDAQGYKSVQVDTAGTLSALLTPEEMNTVTNLTLTGNINATDFNTMKNTMPALRSIDLSLVEADGDSIPGYAFNRSIDTVFLPSSLTLIGDYGFASCDSLTSVTIPSSVISLGSYSFAGCSWLTSIAIPDSVNSIGKYAFVACSRLTTISIPTLVTSIDEFTFAGCSSLTSVDIPNSVISIGKYAFVACSSLSSVVIPNSVTSIATLAFASCTLLTDISLSSSLDSIAMLTFAGCNSLASVTIPSSVTSIGPWAFSGCQNLASVNILPSSGMIIKRYAFSGNSGLKSLTVRPSSGMLIEEYAFAGCMALDSLTIYPASGISIGIRAFVGCDNITAITFHSPSITSIADYSFINCSKLASLVLPSSLTSIGKNSFYQCSQLTSLAFPPTTGTAIGDDVFIYCTGLTSLTMATPSVTSIGRNGFRNCSNITSLVLPSSLTSIGESAFSGCTGLTSVTIPSSVDTIGNQAFSGCTNLQSIRVKRLTPVPIANFSSVFWNVNTETCILYVPKGSKDDYAAAYRWKDFKNIVEYDLRLSASDSSVALADSSGSSGAFNIFSNTEWKINADQNWLSISDTMGMDNDSIILTAESNPNTIQRTALITLSGLDSMSLTVMVTQAPKPTLSVLSDTLNIGAFAGSTALLEVISNTNWTANADQTWLLASPSSGNGDSTIVLTAEANPVTTTRETIIIVTADRVSTQKIIVIQTPKPALSVSLNNLSIGASEGSTVLLGVVSNTSWTVNSNQTWLLTSSSSGNGNDTIIFTAEANPYTTIREATITMSADSVASQIVVVTQEARAQTDVREIEPLTIKVYPNPVREFLYIDGAAGNAIDIYDSQGRIVFSRVLESDHETIDLSSLSSGVYIIQAGNSTRKIVK
jgi:hypothetical protein